MRRASSRRARAATRSAWPQRELAAMQETVRQALRQKERLAALGTAVTKINHDLRNILSTDAAPVRTGIAGSAAPEVRRVAPRPRRRDRPRRGAVHRHARLHARGRAAAAAQPLRARRPRRGDRRARSAAGRRRLADRQRGAADASSPTPIAISSSACCRISRSTPAQAGAHRFTVRARRERGDARDRGGR